MSEATPTGREVVLLLSYESVGDIVRRGFGRPPDRLLRSLVDDATVERLLVVGPYRSRPVAWARRLVRRNEPNLEAPGVVCIEPHRLLRHDPTSLEAVARAFVRYDRQVERAAASMGLVRPAVIAFHPLAAGFAPASWAGSVTYYARDDWASLPTYRDWWPACRESYARIRDRGRRVVAVSQVLRDRIAPTGPSIVLENAVAPEEWATPRPVPPWFEELPSPRMLYVGTLDERLDLDALGALGRSFPGGSIVLVGPMPDGFSADRIGAGNVHVVRSQPREQVVALVQHADLCLLTHRRTPLTEAMSPLKLYEYLAGGRPTVATDLAPVRGIHEHVVSYDSVDGIADAARRALAKGPMTERDREAFVAQNNWAERHKRVLALAFQ